MNADPFIRIRLTGLPQHAREHDYERASAEIEARLRVLPGLVAIYRAGSVSALGISDLDHVAVVDGRGVVPSIWESLSAPTKHLAAHSPFLVDVETFRRHRSFAHLAPLRHVAGEPVRVDAPPQHEHGDLLIATEGLVLSLLRALKGISTNRVKVRSTLCELHNVRHGLALARLEEQAAPRAWALTREVGELRRTWFDDGGPRPREAAFRDLLGRVLPALGEALAAIAQKVGDGACGGGSLALGGAWSNVTLTGAAGPWAPTAPSVRLRALTARSRRASEARWRLLRPETAVPAAVLCLLRGDDPAHGAFRARREEIVRAYRRFIAACEPGYSTIGLSPMLTGR